MGYKLVPEMSGERVAGTERDTGKAPDAPIPTPTSAHLAALGHRGRVSRRSSCWGRAGAVVLDGRPLLLHHPALLVGRTRVAAQRQAFANATLIRSSLIAGNTGYADLSASLDAGSDSHSILIHKGKPYTGSLSLSPSSIPDKLRDVVLVTAATQTFRSGVQGQPQIVVGVPIPSVQAAYFEVFPLSDLDHILRVLGLTLIGGGHRDHLDRGRPRSLGQRSGTAPIGRRLESRGGHRRWRTRDPAQARPGRSRPGGADYLIQRNGR